MYHVPYHNEVAKLAIALNFYKLFTILLRHDDAVYTMHEAHNAVYTMHEAHNILMKCFLILYIFNAKKCR